MNQVTIRRDCQLIRIHPYVPPLDDFTTSIYRAGKDSEYGIKLGRVDWELIEMDKHGNGVACAGLESIIRAHLESQGYQVLPPHGHQRGLPTPQRIRGRSRNPIDLELLNFIQTHERGIIRYFDKGMRADSVDIVWLLRQIDRAWPQHRKLVICSRHTDIAFLARRLPGSSAIISNVSFEPPLPQFVISSYRYSGSNGVDLRSVKICIALNAHESFSYLPARIKNWKDEYQDVQPIRNRWFERLPLNVKVFGLLPASLRLNVLQRDTLLSQFGHEVFTIPQHGSVQRRVHPVYIPFKHRGRRSQDVRVVDVKRYVWRSQKRNGALAQLVYELTRDPHWTLQAVGRDCSSIQMKIDRPRIGILVDSVDHAFHLAKKLPEASVSVGTPINTAAWAAPLKAWAEDYAKSTAPLRDTVITTHAGMSAIGRVNILINATTAPAPPRLPDEQLCSANPEDELLLLDIQDTDGGLLTKHSQSRMELYKRMPVDTACAKAALLTFLRTREEWQDDEF